MIVYEEFSSLVKDLGVSGEALYTASNHLHKHYHPAFIPKSGDEYRRLYVPDEFLKAIQRRINDKLLAYEEISPYATAYRPCGSTIANANPHVGKPVMLKLDIRKFFDYLIYPMVKEKAFPKDKYSEQNRVLLSLLCTYMDALPQGAPTSPTISNIIMREFDNKVGDWCAHHDIAYTRYCDDMTFSGDFDPWPVKQFVKNELKKLGLFLNEKKTVVVRKGQKHSVTGIIVNEKISIPSEYKVKIRQEIYYCRKFGVKSHLARKDSIEREELYLRSLLGRVNYVLSVEPDNEKMREYKTWVQESMKEVVYGENIG